MLAALARRYPPNSPTALHSLRCSGPAPSTSRSNSRSLTPAPCGSRWVLPVRTGPPVGGVDLSHSAWQPCHRQRPSAILNLEGAPMCTCCHSADAHHHWQRLDSTACSKCDCPRWQRPRSPVLQDPPSPLSQRLLGVTFMRPPGVSWS